MKIINHYTAEKSTSIRFNTLLCESVNRKIDMVHKLRVMSVLFSTFRDHYLSDSYQAVYSIFDNLKNQPFVNVESAKNGSVFYLNPINKTAIYMAFVVYKCEHFNLCIKFFGLVCDSNRLFTGKLIL